jgi:hypothetical protein
LAGLTAAGCWLLAAGCWLLAAGCWLLVAGVGVGMGVSNLPHQVRTVPESLLKGSGCWPLAHVHLHVHLRVHVYAYVYVHV